jgi:glyoxylase-like metal-dependent hydrolase (beta-lactamase superfamily II)
MPWLVPHYANAEGRLRLNVQSWIVETPSHKIIVDTCIGNNKANRSVPVWNGLNKPFLNDLAAAGYPIDTIDTVLCTHLHVDHVGWNTTLLGGKWVPTFANAATCSARPSMSTGPRIVRRANTGRCSRIPCSRLSMPDAPT